MTFLKEEYPTMDGTEEREFYDENCEKIYRNTKFYLEHLDDGTLWVYRVSFLNYKKTKHL